MKVKDWLKFPEPIKSFIFADADILTNEIATKFDLDGEQFNYIGDVEDEIFLKKINPLALSIHLDKMPNAKNVDVRLLALDLAYKVFWPLQDYLGEVNKLILRLGGKVPRQKTLKVSKDDKDDGIFQGTEENSVHNMLDRYNNFISLRLTSNKIKNKDSRIVSPTVENWIEDYVHFLGAGEHDSLKRARYLSKAPNILKSSEVEREKLRYFFVSYDEDTPVFFHLDKGMLMVEEFQKKEAIKIDKDIKIDIDKVLDIFHKDLIDLDKRIIPVDILMSEAGNNVNKVRDIFWQAIGIGDKDKAISCVKLLIDKKSFDSMLREDSRFKNILKRFIGIKYGQNMERSLDENIDQLIARRIFLEMFLLDKLSLKEESLYVTAYYLTNILANSGQVVYLDKREQKFKWRNIQVLANKFVWVDKV